VSAVGLVVFGCLVALPPAIGAAPSTELVPGRSGVRLQAIATLSATTSDSPPCLTPVLQTMRAERQRGTAVVRRSLAALVNDPALPSERIVIDADGSTLRFTADRSAFDRIDVVDDNGNGRPDAVDEALSGIARAQRLLVGQLELPNPGAVDVVLGRLGSDVEGVSVPPAGRQGRLHIWLDPTGVKGVLRRAAEHQYAHAVATAAGLDPAWGEAFSHWAAIALEGSPDDRALASVAMRFAALGSGLVVDDLDLASGNAAWFTFLDESYGPTAVKLAVEELGRGGSDQAALDRAMRRATGDTLDAALREYQVWSLLVGSRADGRHFSFARQLPGPTFAASLDSLPALSIQSDPEIGPMGSALVQMRPGERNGGLTIRFEGDLAARWAADLLLVLDDGELHRVPLPLDADDAGEISVPLQDVREVLMLVRNLDGEGRPARRYSWAAHFEPGFPTEFGTLRADPAGVDGGALVSWETSSERGLLGFNVLRARSDRGDSVRVNPVWIPSLGESGSPASYSFFDATAEPGVAYRYRIQAVTLEGLASRSEAVALTPAP
jgi:hypothetical protein